MVSPAAQLPLIQPISSASIRTLAAIGRGKAQSPAEQSREERNRQARHEIQSFLRALKSYPARFAEDPGMSFEEYCRCLINAE
jgi:hypothetical protein